MSTRHESGDLDGASRETLYEMAKKRAIEGRSAMSKDQLRAALSEPVTSQPVGSRVEQFRPLAEASARGELVMLPRSLTSRERRMHVRRTLREDHQVRIARHAEEAHLKFEKLAGSLFSFFRGTALLFYRDMAGQDARMPTVLVHRFTQMVQGYRCIDREGPWLPAGAASISMNLLCRSAH